MIKNAFLKKTLLFNLIFFDFILLESSTNRISNFFLEKFFKKKNFLFRLSLFELFPAFKQIIKLFQFLKNKNKKKITYFWAFSEYILEFFQFFFKKLKPNYLLKFQLVFPEVLCTPFSDAYCIKNAIIIDQTLTNHQFFSFFYKRLYLIQFINYLEKTNWYTYNLFADLNDYKKLIFFCIIVRMFLIKV